MWDKNKIKIANGGGHLNRLASRLGFMSRQSKSGLIKSTSKWKAYTYSLGIFVLSFMTAFLAASVFNTPNNTNAEEGDNTSSASASGYNLSVSATSSVNLNLSVSDSDTMTISEGYVSVITNSPGYRLYISMTGDNTSLTGVKDGLSSTIAATSGTIAAPTSLTRGTWGYAIPSGTAHLVSNNFSPSYSTTTSTTPDSSKLFAVPPVASSNPALLASSTSATSGDTYPVYYAVQANSDTAPGNYTNNIAFTAVADAGSSKTLTVTPQRINSGTATTVTVASSLYSTAGYANANVYLLTAAQYASISGTNVEALGVNPLSCTHTSYTPVTYSCTVPATSTAGIYYLYAKFPVYEMAYSVILPVMNSSVKFFTATTMQQFTDSTYCSSATTPAITATEADTTGYRHGNTAYVPQTTLVDTRNNEVYTVRKLADGNCWMTENLRLELSANQVLTSATSDVTANRTVGLATQPYNQASTNRYNWGVAATTDFSEATVDRWLSRSTKVGSTWSTETTPVQSVSDDRKQDLTGEDQKTGVYYNWYTATAGTGTWSITTAGTQATDSVCPAGWQLPRYSAVNGTSTTAPNKSWMYLIRDIYQVITTQGDQGSSSTANAQLHAFPFSLPYSGDVRWQSGGTVNQGANGNFWSAGATSQTNARSLNFSGTLDWPEYSSYRLYGFSVRCVAK